MPLKNSEKIHSPSFFGVTVVTAVRISVSHHDICLVVVVSGDAIGVLDAGVVVGEMSVKEVCPQPMVLTIINRLVTINEK